MKNFLLPLIFLQIVLLKAQSPEIIWSQSFGNEMHDAVYGFYQISNGDFIGAGYTKDPATSDYDGWVFGTDASGNLQWEKEFYIDTLDERFSCMRPTPDGNFILGGEAERTDGFIDMYIKKIDSSGNSIASNRFGNVDYYYNCYDVDVFANGTFIFVGRNLSAGSDFNMIHTFANLNLIYGNVGDWEWTDIAYGVGVTNNDGYVVIGTTNSWGLHSYNIFILKMSGDGYYENYSIIGSTGDQVGYCVEQTSDSCYILCGSTTYQSQDRDIYIAKVNKNLDLVWMKRYGSTYHDKGVKIIENSEGGYTCLATAHNNRSFDIYVLRLDEYGDTLWTKHLGDPSRDESASSIARTDDGGYIIAGNQLVTSSNLNPYLVRLAKEPHEIKTYHRFALDKDIPDLGVASDILTVDDGGTLAKIMEYNALSNVTVIIDTVFHTNISDLTILLSHEGITDTLVYQNGEEGSDIIECNLTDASTISISEGEAPLTGSFKPHSPLSVFSGVNPSGDWTLTINDGFAGNEGTLEEWGLRLYFDKATSIKNETPKIPTEFVLYQNYPNPFNPSTKINYSIKDQSFVTLKIFDVLGREIKTLINKVQPPGSYGVEFDATNLTSGIYFYRITAGKYTETRKMILLR